MKKESSQRCLILALAGSVRLLRTTACNGVVMKPVEGTRYNLGGIHASYHHLLHPLCVVSIARYVTGLGVWKIPEGWREFGQEQSDVPAG